jgi:hypothetical protein
VSDGYTSRYQEEERKRLILEVTLGTLYVFGSDVPGSPYGVVLEDDGQAAYLSALDRRSPEHLDVLHVYTVPEEEEPEPRRLEIAWSDSGDKVALLLEGVPAAALGFELNLAFCRSGFPAAESGFAASHTWNDLAFSKHWDFLHEHLRRPLELVRIDRSGVPEA